MSEKQLGHTLDGVKVAPGMTVYCVEEDEEVYRKFHVTEHIVDSVADSGRKVLFKNPGPDEYQGARLDGVFAYKKNAEECAAHPWWLINLQLDEHDASLIRYALGRELAKVQGELSLLQVASKRDLEKHERAGLPVNIQDYTREELIESIDPWISLSTHVAGVLKDITDGLEACKKPPDFS